jgi:tetratricopeptide (TPR) repeat protein
LLGPTSHRADVTPWRASTRVLMGVAALLAAAMAPIAAARAQQSDELRACTAGTAPEQKLASCTAVIEAGLETPENLAIARDNRGNLYLNKPDYDRAIADFEAAIQLN